ncbi:MAG: tRNA dihydrouridine synthase DusB [Clostridiales bacterium]|jgi:nifR3 family TIM-barrel protein|nr:tRNA dihydrouridine synthase DusB [Clostridiales bacterium]
MKFGKITLKNNLMLAPLAGYTDIGFRHIAVKHGAALTFSEMVSIKGLIYNNEKTRELLLTSENETPCAVQLFGSDPEIFYRAAACDDLKKFDVIDINMGCPVNKIVKNNEGSALMKDKTLVKEIVAATVAGASGRTVTVKMRSGFDRVNAPEIAAAARDGGADAVTVHPRLREQFYGGRADWDIIRLVKEAVNIPVVASGDVTSYDDYKKITEISHCDFVMIGRGAVGNPYIFDEILCGIAKDGGGEPLSYLRDKRTDIFEHTDLLLRYYGERSVVNDMKKHIAAYAKGVKNAKEIKDAVMRADTVAELRAAAEKFF